MRVRDVMTRRVRTLQEDDTTALAKAVVTFWTFRHLPVLDSTSRVVGMLTPTDLLAFAQKTPSREVGVSEVMRPPVTIGQDEDLDRAIEAMRLRGIHALPVVDSEERLVGIVTDVNALRALTGARPDLRLHLIGRTRVQEIMTPQPISVRAETSLGDATKTLLQRGFRHLPVTDRQGRLVGILSERDVRTHLGVDIEQFSRARLDALATPVLEAMTPNPISLHARTPLADALGILAVERIGALPVVDEGETLVGILSYVDVLTWLRDQLARGPVELR